MSRLDQHIRLVRNKMALDTLLRAVAWAGILFGAVVTLTIIVERLTAHSLPRQAIWFWSGLGLAMVLSVVYAGLRRPSAQQAAVAIDERLSLDEKFSTALYVRPSKDPFAAAAVRDAEKTADKVSLHKRFPLKFPRSAWATFSVATVALLVAWLMPTLDLFGSEAQRVTKAEQRKAAVSQAEKDVKKAMAAIEAAPTQVIDDGQIKLAMKELPELFKQTASDPARVTQRAQETLKAIEAIKQKIKDENKYSTLKKEFDTYKNMGLPSPEETGPVADAHRALSEGKLDAAVEDLKKAVDKFEQMDKEQQEKAAEQMKKLAQQIAQQANNPQTQQNIQQQLQQAGVSQQQAKQMQQLMQQAANGNQQAAQQLAQMANQAAQQANQQSGQSPQQQQQVAQQIQQAVKQAQQQANAQANAQAMQQAAGQLAQAMQQAAAAGQQGGQQQANGQSKQGSQPGKQGQQGGQGQQMAQAAQAMQQQLQQLQAQANGAAGVAAGQNAGQAGQNGQGQGQGQGAQQAQNGRGQGQGGQWAAGDPNQNKGGQGGQGGPGVADTGRRPDPIEVPFGTKVELSNSQTDEKGKILASSFVKAPAERGESKMTLNQVVEAELKEATDEVQQDRIPRSAQKAVKGYFETLKTTPPAK